MCIQLQEADLEAINDGLHETIKLARAVVSGGDRGVKAGLLICYKCREIQDLINDLGILQEGSAACLVN